MEGKFGHQAVGWWSLRALQKQDLTQYSLTFANGKMMEAGLEMMAC